MNSKHRKTLAAVFVEPVPATIEWSAIEWSAIEWSAIEALLVAAGCRIIEGTGSRVKFERDGLIASFHRPHPAKEAKRYQVRDAREYLEKLGMTP